jgi:hypothetical protein
MNVRSDWKNFSDYWPDQTNISHEDDKFNNIIVIFLFCRKY